MKILGVAPLIAIPTFVYLGLTVIISYSAEGLFRITQQGYSVLVTVAIIIIIMGVLMVISCGRKLLKSFSKGVLMIDGLYRIFRDLMYASYLLFVIPGISLIFNSWLALTTVIINYIFFYFLIKRDYTYLHEKFGKEYEDYLEKVLIKFL